MIGPDDLQPLPGTRDEVRKIAALYPKQTTTFLGLEATEERARSETGDARYLHFACHALVDDGAPLNSALALAVPSDENRENGLLQAWEIFESLRINADLVTLSACDTALGKEMSGEGIVGLTRAFQYAGARSVLASLWKVSDKSTTRLMERFYTHLKHGRSKDEALRLAQVSLLHDEEQSSSHPFYWAAFELIGDWQ